jgi:hypothetical protein
MICAILPLHRNEGAIAGLETCGHRHTDYSASIARTFRTLKRTKQEGRIPPRAVARAKFCYHSLQRISTFYITLYLPWQLPQSVRFLQTLNSCDSLRIASALYLRKSFHQNFLSSSYRIDLRTHFAASGERKGLSATTTVGLSKILQVGGASRIEPALPNPARKR